MYKHLLRLFGVYGFLCFIAYSSFGQNIDYQDEIIIPTPPANRAINASYFGLEHTPRGDLHFLIVFVNYAIVANDTITPNPNWPNWSNSPNGPLPTFMGLTGSINELFNADPNTISPNNQTQNLSEYFYVMSNGTFRVTADIYPQQVTVNYDTTGLGLFNMNIDAANQITNLEIANGNDPNVFWSQYDNRENTPFFDHDNSITSPDNLIDYVIFIHRNDAGLPSGFAQITSGSSQQLANTNYSLNERGGHTQAVNTRSQNNMWDFITHEFAHNLYCAPHLMGANSVMGNKYIQHFGWGLMSQSLAPFFTVNAWERWWFDWEDPITVSPTNNNGTYVLGDFVASGDALRIEIPGSGGQFVWLENHQKINRWDDKQHFSDVSMQADIDQGMYGYITHNGMDNRALALGPGPNDFKILHGEGRWDMNPTPTKIVVPGISGGNPQTVFDTDTRVSNPLSGLNSFQGIPYNKDPSTSTLFQETAPTSGSSSDRINIFAERISSLDQATYASLGDGLDGLTTGTEISLSGLFPALNFQSYDALKALLLCPSMD